MAKAVATMNNVVSFMLIYIVGLFAMMFFFYILPAKRKNKKMQELQASLALGDEVSTISGIIGTIAHLDEDLVTILVDDKTGTTIKVVRPAIQSLLTKAK